MSASNSNIMSASNTNIMSASNTNNMSASNTNNVAASNTNNIVASNEAIYSKTKNRIACLIVGDSHVVEKPGREEEYSDAIAELFIMLKIYDKYLSPFCDVKVFIVDNSQDEFLYNHKEIESRLPNSAVGFIPRNTERFARKQHLYTYHMISYAYTHCKNYEWYLKLSNIDKLLMVDHFEKLVYDESGQSVYNMDKPKLIGHAMKDPCADFIYSLTVYAFNEKFLLTIGKLATEHIRDDKMHIDQEKQCKSHGLCTRHAQDDFIGFCLTDLGVNIEPTRDTQNREYFLIYDIRDHYVKMTKWEKDHWYWNGKSRKAVGKNCCANYPIAFSNYGDSERLETAYEKIYAVTPQERTMKFLSNINYFNDHWP